MQRKSGINMSDVKVSNRAMILNLVNSSPKSRKDIAAKLKLTPAAITMLVTELIEQGCVKESGLVSEPVRAGRKKVFIELNKNYKYVIGVNIEGRQLTIGLGNLKYEVIASISDSIVDRSSNQVMSLCIKLIKQLLKESQIDVQDLLGIGVGIVGKVDTLNGVSKHAYGIWDNEVAIADILYEAFKLPVIVENNVRALALAEMELTVHRKISNMVFLKLGPGIGSAVILENEIYKGAHNDSGEIGHMILDLEGKKCRCGLVGCLETVASIQCLLETIQEDYKPEAYKILDEIIEGEVQYLTEEHLIEAYKAGDQEVIKKVDDLIKYLAVGIINSLKLYDPHKLVLYSEMFNETILYKKLISEIEKHRFESSLEGWIEKSHLTAPKCVGGIVLSAKEFFYNIGGVV